MLTVADVLQQEGLNGAEVVGGRAGLSRCVEWVHNVGVPDAPRWLNGGEFVLTTAINLPAEPAEQEEYLLWMIEKGIAALGITIGRYITVVPDYLITIADQHQFPLIAIPYQARFVDIAREVNKQIAQREVKRALEIHQTLTQLVLEGDIPHLAETLAQLVQQSVSIENERFERLGGYNLAPVDEARRYTQKYGQTDPRLVRALEERGFMPELRRTLRPVKLPKMPDVGLELERILAPIVVKGAIYGYVWIIADGRPFGELEQMAIESGATVAALMLLREEAIQREEASQRGDLLMRLLQEPHQEAFLTDRALRFGVDLRQKYHLLLIEATGTRAYTAITRVIEREQWSGLVGQFSGHLVVILPVSVTIDTAATQIHAALTPATKIGISATHQGASQISAAYHDTREALEIAQRLAQPGAIHRFGAQTYLHALYRAGEEALQGNHHLPALYRLQEEHGADLFHTLEVYLDSGGNGVATADLLHIHRSTLNYRLSRITEILGADLSDPATRTDLQITLKLLRLFPRR